MCKGVLGHILWKGIWVSGYIKGYVWMSKERRYGGTGVMKCVRACIGRGISEGLRTC